MIEKNELDALRRENDRLQDELSDWIQIAQRRANKLADMREVLEQIFAWWDAADGMLVTHYSSTVTPKMREFRSLANVEVSHD